MNMKKILMLGGSYFQIPAIKYAKDAGYYVVTVDYLPDNPGHKFSDEYYNISTTDKEAVLGLAKKLNIDGIVAYASDPAASTAAYVSEKLKLPGNSYKSVNIMTNKDLYREFLRKNGFNFPYFKSYYSFADVKWDFDKFRFPLMVKPTDSSGSKGVSKVSNESEFETAFLYALKFSRSKKVIVEEYINRTGSQIHGDGFVVDGKIVSVFLGDHMFACREKNFTPVATTFPTVINNNILKRIIKNLQRLIICIGFKQGAINIEVMIDKSGNIFLMEVGPRNGGNHIPLLIESITNFDMIKGTVDIALGIHTKFILKENFGFFSYYVIHSMIKGKYHSVEIDTVIERNILKKDIMKKIGEDIFAFNGSNNTVGILLLKFDSRIEMNSIMNNINKYVKVVVK